MTSVKTNPAYEGEEPRTYVGCDSGFNHLIRPTMYGSYHPITNVTRPVAEKVTVDIVGNICESGEVCAERAIQDPRVSDILAIGFAEPMAWLWHRPTIYDHSHPNLFWITVRLDHSSSPHHE